MRRFVTFAVLICFAIPFGISVSGCKHAFTPEYCNGQTSGVQVGQLVSLDLEPRLTGISLNQGEIGHVSAPSGKDCRGNGANAGNIVYASTNLYLADVAPTTGSLCAGSWNRNTNYIADYTVCTPATTSGIAYITGSSSGVVSNAIPIFVHPVVTSIVLGPASTNCTTDPASNCVDLSQLTGCDSGAVTGPTGYNGLACVSQGQTAQLVARTYQGIGTSAANNISCLVGPLQFSANNASVVTIDANGVATAAAPGSSTISANISQASSTAGFFSTCPPASIVLSVSPSTTAPTAPVSVLQNTAETLVATVTDTNGQPMTNIQLEYTSTSPTTIPAASNTITPNYPSAAAITAICQPPNCNPSPFDEIGLFGNGTTVISNPVQIASAGTNFSTVLYIASTNSQYLLPVDFTTTNQVTPVRLPYAPNSLVLSEDQSTIYMGTSYELMEYSTSSNSIIKQDNSVSGYVIGVSPDSNTIVVTDPVRQLIYLYQSSGGVATEYGGVASRAAFSPDSSAVYITTTDGRLLVHSTFTGWSAITPVNPPSDVAVTIPSAGVYLGGNPTGSQPVDVRTNCPATVVSGTGLSATTTNTFYPDLGPVPGVYSTRLAATTNGLHILGATTTAFTDIKTNQKSGACPIAINSTPGNPIPFAGIAFVPEAGAPYPNTAVENILTTSDSAFAFITYTGTGGVVPQYNPSTGALSNIPLQKTAQTVNGGGTPLDAISGVISADNNTLYIGSEGDNLVHILTRVPATPTTPAGFTDTTTPLYPALPNINGNGTAAPNLLAQHPRKLTS